MDSYILPSTTYEPPSRQVRQKLNTIVEDEPTKRRETKEFDDLYDVSESETDANSTLFSPGDSRRSSMTSETPSLTRRSWGKPRKSQRLSLVIPSPRHWPTIEKLKESQAAGTPPIPPKIPLSPASSVYSSDAPQTASLPSLDGSLSSEQHANCSAPPTPVHFYSPERVKDWSETTVLRVPSVFGDDDGAIAIHELNGRRDSGIKLPADAMEVLRNLSTGHSEPASPVEITKEMEEVVPAVHVTEAEPVSPSEDCLSALSIPSPGGFFSSLDDSSRSAWSVASATAEEETAPSSTTALNFYNAPWSRLPETGPESFSVDSAPEILEVLNAICDFSAATSEERTATWIVAHNAYLAALRDAAAAPETGVTRKKTVRFADDEAATTVPTAAAAAAAAAPAAAPLASTAVFYEAFQRMFNAGARADAFAHRTARFEALQAQRASLPTAHRAALRGLLAVSETARPAPSRPISQMTGDNDEEQPSAQQLAVQRAAGERQALEQLAPGAWAVEALRYLFNGRLLNSPAGQALKNCTRPRVLDLGGRPQGDWAWHVALEHPHARVVTAYPRAHAARCVNPAARGPSNHRAVAVDALHRLPFPDAHFDVVSARALHALLRARDDAAGPADDELGACLAECRRVLKPGGCLEFLLLDAELVGGGEDEAAPGPLGTAAGVEFGFALRRRGFAAQPTKAFGRRLRACGFADVRRAWTFLPAGGADASASGDAAGDAEGVAMGSTGAAAPVAGLLGSWLWERWLLELEEAHGDGAGLLADVGRIVEEARGCCSGWRCLSGWATRGEDF